MFRRSVPSMLAATALVVMTAACSTGTETSPERASAPPSAPPSGATAAAGPLVTVNAPSCDDLTGQARRYCRPVTIAKADFDTCGAASGSNYLSG